MKKVLLFPLIMLCAFQGNAQNWQNVQSPWGQQYAVNTPNGYQFSGFSNQNNGYYANYWYNNQYYSQPVNQNRAVVITQLVLNFAQGLINQVGFNQNQGWNSNFQQGNNQNWNNQNFNNSQQRIYYYHDATGRLCWRYY